MYIEGFLWFDLGFVFLQEWYLEIVISVCRVGIIGFRFLLFLGCVVGVKGLERKYYFRNGGNGCRVLRRVFEDSIRGLLNIVSSLFFLMVVGVSISRK